MKIENLPRAIEAKEALTSDNFIYNIQNNPFIINSKFSNKKLINYPITYSLIEIDKSNGELKIKLPAGGLQRLWKIFNKWSSGFSLAGYFIVFCVASFFSILIPGLFYIISALLLLVIGFFLSSKTEILIDRHTKLHIKHKLWNIEYRQKPVLSN